VKIDVDVSGEEIVARDLLRIGRRTVNAAPALREIGSLLEDLVQENFDTEGRAGGAAWKPLAPATVAQKAAAGARPEILQRSGDLLASLTGGPGHIREIGDSWLVFGSGVPYGGFHQKGKGVPQRRPVQFVERGRRQIVKILQRFILTGHVGRSG
jgi:phage gpG-like protein